jgi:hypothetical protein
MDWALQHRLAIVSHRPLQHGSPSAAPQQTPPSVAGPLVHVAVVMLQHPLGQGEPDAQQAWPCPPQAGPQVPLVQTSAPQFAHREPPAPHAVFEGLVHVPA